MPRVRTVKLSKLEYTVLSTVKTRPGITTTDLRVVLGALGLSESRRLDCWRVVNAVFRLIKQGWLRVENESECWPGGVPSHKNPPMRLLLCREIPAPPVEGKG